MFAVLNATEHAIMRHHGRVLTGEPILAAAWKSHAIVYSKHLVCMTFCTAASSASDRTFEVKKDRREGYDWGFLSVRDRVCSASALLCWQIPVAVEM